MSVEIGHSTFPVFVRYPNQSGTASEEIEFLRQEVIESDPDFTELVSAMDIVLDNANEHGEIVGQMRDEGKYLIGISPTRGSSGDLDTIGGLFYAEGEDRGGDHAFSIVRMGAWMSPSRISEYTRESLREDLVDMSLADAGAGRKLFIPVPVRRLTRVLPFHPASEAESEGYVYGHEKELDQIRNLDVPKSLGNVLTLAMSAWHESELRHDGAPRFGEVLDGMQHLRSLKTSELFQRLSD